jgi:sodium-dependent phosphate cotransporter
VVVPIVAKKIASLKQAAPFIMGANIGTTITAFIAVTLNSNTAGAISIAIAHFLFNLFGVLLFFPVAALRRLPMRLAAGLGKLTLKYRLVGFVYILVTFFFIPFSLIYLNQGTVRTLNLRYRQTGTPGDTKIYRMISRINTTTEVGEWTKFYGADETNEPSIIYPVSVKNNTLFVGNQMFMFSRAGFCWDGEDQDGRFQSCIERILPSLILSGVDFDSVYVYNVERRGNQDSMRHRYYFSAPFKILLKHEVLVPGRDAVVLDELVEFERQ